jgi:hypothetical protein
MVIGFQAVWFACAWGVGHHHLLLPILIGMLYLNTYISNQVDKKNAYRYLLRVLIIGFIVDSLIGILGLITFESAYPPPFSWAQPWWMSILWLSFGASIRYSFGLLKQVYWQVTLGMVGGPLAYFSGHAFGAFEEIQVLGYVFLAICYGLTLPYLIKTLPPILLSNEGNTVKTL